VQGLLPSRDTVKHRAQPGDVCSRHPQASGSIPTSR
jgi:hypothetical protein